MVGQKLGLIVNLGDTVKKYEPGIQNPKPNQLEKISTALGLNVSVFLDFNIETVGDILPLLFAIDDSLKMFMRKKTAILAITDVSKRQ